jgi:hypothetical protein
LADDLKRVLSVGQDGSVQTLVMDDEGASKLKTWHLYLRPDGTPVYKQANDPGIDQEGDPFKKPKRSTAERWAGIDQPIGE